MPSQPLPCHDVLAMLRFMVDKLATGSVPPLESDSYAV